jgi:hypothetical protein
LGVGAFSRTFGDALAVAGPPPFAPLGIGGFVAPQHLLDSGYVMMDFVGRRMVGVKGDRDAALAWLRQRAPDSKPVSVVTTKGPNPGHIYLPMSVSGKPDMVAILDTGSAASEVTSRYLGETGVEPNVDTKGVSGTTIDESRVQGQRVRFAGHEFPPRPLSVRTVIQPGNSPPIDGLIGMDILGRCIIAIPQDPTEGLIVIVVPEKAP